MARFSVLLLALTSQVIAANFDCPGVISGPTEGDSPEGYCCVGGILTQSVCDGWPICQGPTTVTQSSVECSTKVYFSNNDYDSLVESASSEYLSDGWRANPTAGSTGAESEETGASRTSESTPTETDNGALVLPISPLAPAAVAALAFAALL